MGATARVWLLLGLAAPAWAEDIDNDGVPDDRDPCPTAAEDKNGHLDEDGCPDERIRRLLDRKPDQDKDGVPDAKDACPLTPENQNGFEDEDGCPESIYDSLTFEPAPAKGAAPKAPPAVTPPPTERPAGPSSAPGLPDRAPGVSGDPVCKGRIDGAWESLVQVGPKPVIRCEDGRRIHAYNAPSMPDGTRGLLYCWQDKVEKECDLRVFYVDASTTYTGTGCFFTTMVARVRGEPDDGPTLSALRAFRDGPMAGHPDVAEYYRVAPGIVAFVEGLPQADEVWSAVDAGWIRPILADIAAGRHRRAHARYRHLVRTLAALRAGVSGPGLG